MVFSLQSVLRSYKQEMLLDRVQLRTDILLEKVVVAAAVAVVGQGLLWLRHRNRSGTQRKGIFHSLI
jgi:hypothetical protein